MEAYKISLAESIPRIGSLLDGVVLIVVSLAACDSDSGASGVLPPEMIEASPEMTDAIATRIQAQAFAVACREVLCAGAPIYAPDDTPEPVRHAIREALTDEATYVDSATVEDRTGPNGLFVDGATLIDVGEVVSTEASSVVGVDVWISRGFNNGERRTYLFEWNGTEWRSARPEETGVTVTTAVP